MSGPLAGKTALITGSTQGIGLAAARRLAAAGCDVVLHGFGSPADVEALRANIERDHAVRARYDPADLRDPAHIVRMIEEASRGLGSIDILINNAVVRHAAPVEAFPPDAWDESLAVNLSAAFHAIRLVVPGMKQRSWGRIINVSSIYGLRGATNRVGYVTTKTALIGLTRAVALETVADGITCNAICPGTTETPVHEATVQSIAAAKGLSRPEAEREVLTGKQPTGRFVGAGSIAALIEFLCGPDAADITGAALPIDGGWSSTA
jgi:3-hydroxybutyrate dehydrogenase